MSWGISFVLMIILVLKTVKFKDILSDLPGTGKLSIPLIKKMQKDDIFAKNCYKF
uniref:Uncharacterized protein n=1 Tax=Pristhesancus plagipennis TaxID=1955184 RepID=A0A2K8JSR0_PRIPG|nr:secreted hypothetical protein [Pristhesancus plagipennis]